MIHLVKFSNGAWVNVDHIVSIEPGTVSGSAVRTVDGGAYWSSLVPDALVAAIYHQLEQEGA